MYLLLLQVRIHLSIYLFILMFIYISLLYLSRILVTEQRLKEDIQYIRTGVQKVFDQLELFRANKEESESPLNKPYVEVSNQYLLLSPLSYFMF